MDRSPCPDEAALWPVATADSAPDNIQRHVDGCSGCRTRIARLRQEIGALRSMAPVTEVRRSECRRRHEPSPLPGQDLQHFEKPEMIDRYPVRRLLRCGGQGAVYLARHPELGIDVVIKWAHAAATSRLQSDSLKREAQLLARIRHPNLARVLDAGIAAGRTFLVLEDVRGVDLKHAFAGHKQPAREACRILSRIAAAVAEVHRYGVLHGDIKPENIIIGEDGEPRLIDLGSARVFDATGEPAADASAHGTLEYMAPELRTGSAASEQSDVYSLGAVFLELLTGESPRIERDWGCGDPPRLGWERMAAPHGPRADELRGICLRAMHPEPKRRFAGAAEFSRALEQYVQRSRRDRRVVVAAAAAAALLSAAAALPVAQWNERRLPLPNPPPRLEVQLGTDPAGRTTVQAEYRTAEADHSGLFIVFPDGLMLPFSPIETIRHGQTQITRAPPRPHQLVLCNPEQTAMIVAARMPRSETAAVAPVWLREPLPGLTAGTALRIRSDTKNRIAVSVTPPSGSPVSQARLRRLIDRLDASFGCFDALLFAPPAENP